MPKVFKILKDAFYDWLDDKAPRLGAALAYYTIFSMAPLLIIAIAIAGLIFGKAESQGHIMQYANESLGPQAAQALKSMLANASRPRAGMVATIISVVTIIVGAMAVFVQLKDAMNTVWDVEPKPGPGIKYYILNYVFSFIMVLGIGLVLLASLILSTIVAALGTYFQHLLPGGPFIWQFLHLAISFLLIMLLFAMIFKILPDVYLAWRDVWFGAALTSILFTIGKYGLSLYLSRSSVGSAYGAAGSILVILLWVYYSAQILFFGAEITQVYAKARGSEIRPKENARRTK